MKSKSIIGGCLLVLVMVLIGGWYFLSPKSSTTTSIAPKYSQKIVIGISPWPGHLPLLVARDMGFFKDAGLDVEVKEYNSLSESGKDYVAGLAQADGNLTLDATRQAIDGLKHKIVVAVDYSSGSDGIIALPTISSIKGLKGKKVGYEFGTLEEYFLNYALTQTNLTLRDVTSVNLDPEKSAKAFVNGTVDVAVTYEPFMSPASKQKGGNMIYSSKDAPGLITDVITFRSDFIDKYPEEVQVFVKAYFRGVQYWKDYPEESYEILAKEYSITKDEAKSQMQGVTLLDDNDNKKAFTYAPGLQSLYGNLRETVKFLSKTKKIPSGYDGNDLVEPRFIRALFNK